MNVECPRRPSKPRARAAMLAIQITARVRTYATWRMACRYAEGGGFAMLVKSFRESLA
jgi:hypothetical protein